MREPALLEGLQRWFDELWTGASEAITREQLDEQVAAQRTRAKALAQLDASLRPSPAPGSRPAPRRSLGALGRAEPKSRTLRSRLATPLPATAEAHVPLIVRALARSRTRSLARVVLDVLAEALEVSGLDQEDLRLHVGCSSTWPINLTIASRSVAWLQPKGPIFGLLLDDPAVAEQMQTRSAGAIDVFEFGPPPAPAIRVPFDHLSAVLADVRPSWHRAIANQVARRTKAGLPFINSYRANHHSAVLHTVLTDAALRETLLDRVFPNANA